MQIEIFRGVGRIFAFVLGKGAEKLPERYGPWTPFKSVNLVWGQAQPGVNVDECLDDIEKYGIHVTDAHIRITEEAIA
jgi:hypothetical protein